MVMYTTVINVNIAAADDHHPYNHHQAGAAVDIAAAAVEEHHHHHHYDAWACEEEGLTHHMASEQEQNLQGQEQHLLVAAREQGQHLRESPQTISSELPLQTANNML
jgi:hypothetical protein